MTTATEIATQRATTIKDEIRASCHRLLKLLDDPQPGLFTWWEEFQRESERLKALLP